MTTQIFNFHILFSFLNSSNTSMLSALASLLSIYQNPFQYEDGVCSLPDGRPPHLSPDRPGGPALPRSLLALPQVLCPLQGDVRTVLPRSRLCQNLPPDTPTLQGRLHGHRQRQTLP